MLDKNKYNPSDVSLVTSGKKANIPEGGSQFSALLHLLSDKLPTLIRSIDPVHKEVLLPFLRVVAIHGGTQLQKAAARQQLLTLFKKPNRGNREVAAKEWIRVVEAAPQKSIEHEIIPELYTLVNAKTEEQRLLALECVCLLSTVPAVTPKICFSLCQGLLRPLCEDDSSSVRREIPRCIPSLWTDPRQFDENTEEFEVATSLMKFLLELIFKLAIDSYSNSVRSYAQSQLTEVIYPKVITSGTLLTDCIPLLLALMSFEITNLTVSSTAAASSAVKGNQAKANESVLSLTNISTLTLLIENAVHCLKADISNREEQMAPADLERYFEVVCEEYTSVILPTMYSLLLSVCQHMKNLKRGKTLIQYLCQLTVSLASIVTSLNNPSWDTVRKLLLHSIQPKGEESDSLTYLKTNAIHTESLRYNMLIFYVFLVRVSGEQVGFLEKGHKVSDYANLVAQDASGLISRTFVSKTIASSLIAFDSRIELCAEAIANLESVVFENEYISAGIMSVIWTCSESTEVSQRLHAITLVQRTCALLTDDAVKTTFVCTPLLVLLNDSEPTVQEMSVKAFISIAVAITDPQSQEKMIRPALAMVEGSGCLSGVTQACLHQWEMLIPTMPAEPREKYLYPQLQCLVSQLIKKKPTIHRSSGSSSQLSSSSLSETELWERVVDSIARALESNLRCAVVTPWLVSKYLIPSIKAMKESECLLGNSPSISAIRTKWFNIMNAYEAFVSRSTGVTAQNASNLLNRFRDELIKRL
ncbi:hypothetical protein AGDE_07462 [Angomonas deanei]|uniref:Uncharacterized protein n=1 Tax=Angomonas deanei TaxID=59799 RepID=A0A7G2C1E3_9TRYP|nr:hypothetical protein AGDE_07462 [Angomonas deanei]CAD2213124.1 hypothetical protein, conserved [Angomonas deanei]|eukprot:EPY35322.1 hypothetical protein AGDE_07462 [Angomonas deanei]